MKQTRRTFIKEVTGGVTGGVVASALGVDALEAQPPANEFISRWPRNLTRVWIGPEYWANRLLDWRINDGRLECTHAAENLPMRTVHLLTRRLGETNSDFRLSVQTGLIESNQTAREAATGFLLGAGGAKLDYRAAALVHNTPGPGGGLFAGLRADGALFFRDFNLADDPAAPQPLSSDLPARVELRLVGKFEQGNYQLQLSAHDPQSGQQLGPALVKAVAPEMLIGNLALVSHPGAGAARFWFRDWRVAGAKVEQHDARTCGPVLCTQYTLHNRTLKLTAQMMPVGAQESQTVELQTQRGKKWVKTATAQIVTPGHTATFRVPNWDARKDTPYRVVYPLAVGDNKTELHHWAGTIRRDPADKQTITVASLSCVEQTSGAVDRGGLYRWIDRVWYPHNDLLPNLTKQQPDLLFFAGDQIYEGIPTRIVREPAEDAVLDYLYKWYLWCWPFRELTKDIPCVAIPDDHDVYHGNIWGMGGQPARPGDPSGLAGGYGMPPAWLNMIQRTHTSHLPDPYDPTPVAQGINVYYTALVWGGVGFAIIEDRKFKSSPTIVKAEMTRDSHITEKNFDTRQADVPGAQLLGDRQLKFLREFAGDWRGQQMKACLSQTIFCNLQISSRPPTTGELDKDLDSNGWPQSGRRAALAELRRGFMLHLAGDQHLASAIHHGVDEFGDACWSLCSPAISNFYVRFWNPDYPPVDGQSGRLPFTGKYEDGFHNKLIVHAVANPTEKPRPNQFPQPVELHRKAPGYAIAKFNKADRTITLEVWPRYVDPTDPRTGAQYAGWPITIKQTDNYGRRAAAYLPTIEVEGASDPVVQVINEASGEMIYALRMRGKKFQPQVFEAGKYTVKVSDPERGKLETLAGLEAKPESSDGRKQIRL